MLDYCPYLGRYVVIKPSKVSVQKYLEVTSMHHVHKTVQVIPIAMEMKNVALMVILIEFIIAKNAKKRLYSFLIKIDHLSILHAFQNIFLSQDVAALAWQL